MIEFSPANGPVFEHAPTTTMQAVAWLTCSLREAYGAAMEDAQGEMLESILAAARYADLLKETKLRDTLSNIYSMARDPRTAVRRRCATLLRMAANEWENVILRENNTRYITA